MNEILQKILESTVPTIVIALGTLCFRAVREFLFFEEVHYDLNCERKNPEGPFPCKWEINWDDYRLKLLAEDISSERIDGLVVRKLGGKEHTFKEPVYPTDQFVTLFDGKVVMRLISIVKRSQENTPGHYTVRLAFRRRQRLLK